MTKSLLFLPGAGADPEIWKPLSNQLPDTWEKIHFRWPGLGNQKPAPHVNSLDDLVSIVENSLGDQPVDLLAQSMGGHVAIRIMLKHPDKIRRAVFTATGVGLNLAQFGGEDWIPDYQKEYPNAKIGIMDEKQEYKDVLSQITQPVLLLYADMDPICPVIVGEHLSELLPNAKLIRVKSSSHTFISDNPNNISEYVIKYLEETT
ncbi:MAG: alpha/beta hydrolase [Thermodesulfobacteriota bacterium]|nr:alpha/beta hydrolase [Thermodesulfobacteriota bacterium]